MVAKATHSVVMVAEERMSVICAEMVLVQIAHSRHEIENPDVMPV